MKDFPPVKSLSDLYIKAREDVRYEKLAIVAAQNLGGFVINFNQAKTWLDANAQEVDESSVVDEVNFCRDLVQQKLDSQ